MIKLLELIDLYSPNELNSKGIDYNIIRESSIQFRVELKYKDHYYVLRILPLFNPKRPSVNLGSTDKNYENLNLNILLNRPESKKILPAVFGLIKYWIDKFNIKEFEYGAEGEVRNKIYDYYINKHFPEFEKNEEDFGEHKIYIWKKKQN